MRIRTQLLAGVALALITVLSAGAQTSDPCAESRLPKPVNDLIKSKFPGWRIEQVSDLSTHDRQL
jgi:hypothetical protein